MRRVSTMKILVGYCGKEEEKNLLEHAVKHAKAFDGKGFYTLFYW